MKTTLETVIAEAQHLPEADQQELAVQIEDMIIQRKIAAAEADIKAGRVSSLDDAFQRILHNLTKKYGQSSAT